MHPVASLAEAAAFLNEERPIASVRADPDGSSRSRRPRMSTWRTCGARRTRSALEIAAAGGHHVLLMGPPATACCQGGLGEALGLRTSTISAGRLPPQRLAFDPPSARPGSPPPAGGAEAWRSITASLTRARSYCRGLWPRSPFSPAPPSSAAPADRTMARKGTPRVMRILTSSTPMLPDAPVMRIISPVLGRVPARAAATGGLTWITDERAAL